jgi:hypothetical protein
VHVARVLQLQRQQQAHGLQAVAAAVHIVTWGCVRAGVWVEEGGVGGNKESRGRLGTGQGMVGRRRRGRQQVHSLQAVPATICVVHPPHRGPGSWMWAVSPTLLPLHQYW